MKNTLIPKKIIIHQESNFQIQSYQQAHLNHEAPAVLCFHGWLDNSSSFFPLAECLPHIPWCALDLAGHGHSSWRPTNSYYYFWDYLCDISNLIEQYFPAGVHVLGHSLGSGVALLLAGLIPKKIHSVALIDGIGPLVTAPDLIPQEFRFSMQQHSHQKSLKPYHSIDEMASARQKRHQIALSSCQLLAEYGSFIKDSQHYWSFDPKLFMLPPFQMTEEQILAIIKHIESQVLIIQAENGYKVEEGLLKRRQEALHHVLEHHMIPGYHHVHMDSPACVAPLLQDFWNKVGLV